MMSNYSSIQKVTQWLYPMKSFVFLLSIVLIVILVSDAIYINKLTEHQAVTILLTALWGLLLYIFINLLGCKSNKIIQKNTLLYTIKIKFNRIVHSFFIMVFIVLFLFSVFYSYKILTV